MNNEKDKTYSIKWATLASGTHKVKAKNEDDAVIKLLDDIENLKVKVDWLDIDEVEIDSRDIKEE